MGAQLVPTLAVVAVALAARRDIRVVETDDFRELHPVQDPTGSFRQAYGADSPCLYLIRPDGYVGYRAAPVRARPPDTTTA